MEEINAFQIYYDHKLQAMWLIIVSIRGGTNPFLKGAKNNVISLYEKWEKEKIK
jgi:hypothetical protein